MERGISISDIVMNTKSPSHTWNTPTRMVEDQNNSCHAKETAENDFEFLGIGMIVGASGRGYVPRAEGLFEVMVCHGMYMAEQEICRRILNGLHLAIDFAGLYTGAAGSGNGIPRSICIRRGMGRRQESLNSI